MVRERASVDFTDEEHPLIDSLTFQVITVCGYVLDVCERFDQEFPNDSR